MKILNKPTVYFSLREYIPDVVQRIQGCEAIIEHYVDNDMIIKHRAVVFYQGINIGHVYHQIKDHCFYFKDFDLSSHVELDLSKDSKVLEDLLKKIITDLQNKEN